MTLILTVTTPLKIVQASDCRLSKPDGSLVDDEAIKSMYVQCQDADLAISYTGLACLGALTPNKLLGCDDSERTDRWLVGTLSELGFSRLSIEALTESLSEKLNLAVRRLPLPRENKPLSIIMAGYRYSSQQPLTIVISNFEDERINAGPVREQFAVHLKAMKPRAVARAYIVTVNGQVIGKPLVRGLTGFVWRRFQDLDGPEAARRLVWFIRQGSRLPYIGRFIGRTCTSIAISPGQSPFAEFHREQQAPIACAPHLLLRPGVAVADVTFDTQGESQPAKPNEGG